MIELHWIGFAAWVFGAFAIGWVWSTWRANKVLKEYDRHMDKALGAARGLAETTAQLNKKLAESRLASK